MLNSDWSSDVCSSDLILALALLPFPTAFLYLVIGWKAFDDYATDRIRNGRAARPLRAKDLALIDRETSHKWPVQVKVSEVPFLNGNDVELLVDGRATFDSIFAGIEKEIGRESCRERVCQYG